VAPKRHLNEKASDWQLQLSGFPINLIEPVSGIICNVEQKFIHHRIARIYCLNIALQDLYSSACTMAGVGVLCQTQLLSTTIHSKILITYKKNGYLTAAALITAIGAFATTSATCHCQHKTSVVP
jgi:hypothetical protein